MHVAKSDFYHGLLADPAFRRQLQDLRADVVQQTTKAMTAASTEAVRALIELLKPAAPPAVRLGAARSVLAAGDKASGGD